MKVEPIRDRKKILAIKQNLKARSVRNYLLFSLGMNLGLRVSDLLSLKVKDVLDTDYIYLKEKKTNKPKKVKINKAAKEAVDFYFKKEKPYDPDQFLFRAERSGNQLNRIRVWEMMKEWCEEAGVKQKVGSHTFRKSWGFHARKQGEPIELIQKRFGHSSPSTTLLYIGIISEEIEDLEDRVCL
ncbi:MAG: tyrosine-type recombinase/integrase [Clostridia bacterium]|jgi:integrase|nr:tyrosine-type recombinase/integrase [Clostridia bacterium]